MNATLLQVLALIVPLILAIVFHEVAHGYVALLLGDTTARDRRRLSLNPLRHVDPIGTVVVPGMLWLTTHTAFGWAKPVPVNQRRLNNPRYGMMAVAAAGPGANLIMAAIGAVLLGLLIKPYGGMQNTGVLVDFLTANLVNFLWINVFLAFFNLLPIPPFDGSHIAEGLLPRSVAAVYARLRPVGLLLVLLLLIVVPWLVPGFDLIGKFVIPPVRWMTMRYLELAQAVAGIGPAV